MALSVSAAREDFVVCTKDLTADEATKEAITSSTGHNRCSGKHIVRFCQAVLTRRVASRRNKLEFMLNFVAVQQLFIRF